jgi:polyphosphate kinase
MPAATRQILLSGIGLFEEDCYEVSGMLDLTGLWPIAGLDRPDLQVPAWTPVVPARLVPPDEDEPADVFAAIRAGDILVHHPYESFAASVERFIAQAAEDPEVLTIKQTLYRTSGDSPIVQNLIRAAERGKQVVVLVEIKARFDEQANIRWARELERSGVHVVYGLVGLKTHAKAILVVRREGDKMRRYAHLGTGNYNPSTARVYTDLGLLTARESLTTDAARVFDLLTSLSRPAKMERMLVAPFDMLARTVALIRREAEHAKAGRPARIVAKMNALADESVIEALYEASQSGVQVDLVVRGICVLRPGMAGISDRIRVVSIVGRFLEHSRIFSFENGGSPEVYIGSADWMPRNLRHRVEILFPVEDAAIRDRLRNEILSAYLSDRVKARRILPDGNHERLAPQPGEPLVSAQTLLQELAAKAGARFPADAETADVAADATAGSDASQPRRRRRTPRKSAEVPPV